MSALIEERQERVLKSKRLRRKTTDKRRENREDRQETIEKRREERGNRQERPERTENT